MTLIKEAEMGIKRRKLAAAAVEAAPAEGELPDRWSAPRKTELVLRLFRGEAPRCGLTREPRASP